LVVGKDAVESLRQPPGEAPGAVDGPRDEGAVVDGVHGVGELGGIRGADLAVVDRLVQELGDGSSEDPALTRGVCAELGVGEVEVQQRQMVGDRVS